MMWKNKVPVKVFHTVSVTVHNRTRVVVYFVSEKGHAHYGSVDAAGNCQGEVYCSVNV
jgi:hypothetical protein